MKHKKLLSTKTLVAAFIISVILFSSGVFTGYAVNKVKVTNIENQLVDISKNVDDFQLQFLFFDVLGANASCPLLTNRLSKINKQSYDLGEKLTDSRPEAGEVIDFAAYDSVRRDYYKLLVSYWLLANKLKDSCDLKAITLLFFISENCPSCDDQAFILTHLKKKFGDNLLVFTLDASLNEPAIETLRTYYNVTESPTMIIEDERFGFTGTDDIVSILCGNGLCL